MGIPQFLLRERRPGSKNVKDEVLSLECFNNNFATALTEYHTENCPFHFLRGISKLISFSLSISLEYRDT